MNKCHAPIGWVNDQTPAINDTNLNYMDGCIDTIDDRVITLDTTKAEQSDLLLAFKDVSLNSSTGVITFTLFNDTTKTIDTLLEKIAVNFDYDDDPTSAHYQNLIIELEDGTYKYIDMSALITQYEFTNSSTIAFTVGNDGTVSASVIDGSITGAKLQPNYLADVTAQASVASAAASASNANQLLSEGYANGTQGGVPVSSASPYYHNNAKYWKEQAQAIASSTLSGLSDVDIVSPLNGQVLTYNNGDWVNADTQPGILPHVIVTTESGATITIEKGSTIITMTETSTGQYEADVPEFGTWDIEATKGLDTETETINVDTVKIYTVSIAFFTATIIVNYPDNMRGETFTCVNGSTTLTKVAPSNTNTFDFSPPNIGVWTVTGAYSKNATISAEGDTVSVSFVTIKTFATATDAEIAAMVSEADAGYIDLYDDCGWRVGQEHEISLSAIAASGTYGGVSWSVGESQPAQTATLVLTNHGGKELTQSVLDKSGQPRTECSFQWDLKDSLSQGGYLNSTDTNTGSWKSCSRRAWCNYGFYQALPPELRAAFKQFKVLTAQTYNGSTNETVDDYCALRAEKEIFGARTYSNTTEAASLSQATYYATSANRMKKKVGSDNASSWWGRSPASDSVSYYCFVDGNGSADHYTPSTARSISVFGVI